MTDKKTINLSVIYSRIHNGKLREYKIVKSGKKITTLVCISEAYECKPFNVSTDVFIEDVKSGIYRVGV